MYILHIDIYHAYILYIYNTEYIYMRMYSEYIVSIYTHIYILTMYVYVVCYVVTSRMRPCSNKNMYKKDLLHVIYSCKRAIVFRR